MAHVWYLDAFKPKKFAKTVKKLADEIKFRFPEATMLTGQGLSSTMVIPALAARLKLEWAIVRKEKSHSVWNIETSKWSDATDKIVFVDDLIDTGDTFKAVREKIAVERAQYAEIVGAVLYNSVGGIDYHTEKLKIPIFAIG